MIKVKILFLKTFWKWLRKLFQREKNVTVEEKEEKPEEPEPIPEPTPEPKPEVVPEPIPIPETPRVSDTKDKEDEDEKVVPEEINSKLLGNTFSKAGTQGFIRVYNTSKFKKIIHEHFHSIDELLSCLNHRDNNQAMRESTSSNSERSEFSGTSSYDEAVNLLRNGYVSILPKIKQGIAENVNKFKELFLDTKSKPLSSVVGSSPNVPKYLMGLPHSMDDRTREIQKVKTVDIIYFPQGPWHVAREDFVKAGISMLSAIQLLENSGVSISLSCSMYSGYAREEAVLGTVQLKDYKDRLDLKKLCFPIAHPSMLRRIGFRFLETVPGLKNDYFASGYGSSPSHMLSQEMLGNKPNTVVLTLELIRGKMDFNVKQIVAYIKENARRQSKRTGRINRLGS